MIRFEGCYTGLITPFDRGGMMDWKDLEQLIEFQITQGVKGIVACDITGESPTLSWDEHLDVIIKVKERADGHCQMIASVGSNSTKEALRAAEGAIRSGAGHLHAFLLVDPYYNAPSSLEIQREYIAPIAEEFQSVYIIPDIIPSRTGTQLLPPHLASLHHQFPNVRAVKDSTGSFWNMRLIRQLCGEDFDILSGDDWLAFNLMWDEEIHASGVISVISNIAPKPVQELTERILQRDYEGAKRLHRALEPLSNIVRVKTREQTYGAIEVEDRAENPVPIKTLMDILGMPSGPCRRPLGKMTKKGLEIVLDAVLKVWQDNPEILMPIQDFFGVNIEERLVGWREEGYWNYLCYSD